MQNTQWVSKQRRMWKRVWKNVKNLINNFIWLHLEEIIYWLLLLLFSHLLVSDSFATPWIGITQARMLEWVAISFLQGIFLTQGSNPRLLHCRQILYHWATWETQYIGSFLSFSCYVMSDSFVAVQLPSHVWLFATPWTAAHQASWPSLSPGICSNLHPLNRRYHPTISSSVPPSPPTLNLSQYQGLFQWIGSPHQVVKISELQHQSYQ